MPNLLLDRTQRIYQVSELNAEVRELLECHFLLIWLEGEVSNLAKPASGHYYFSLKDASAQVRCALFRNRARLVQTPLQNGQHIQVRARISLYEPRGDFQLIIEQVQDAGEGALRQAFEALRLRLEQAGLFAVAHKRPIPELPQRIGLITSPSGAAIHDVLSVLKRRFPAISVLIYPVQVQGTGAAPSIIKALETADKRQDCDVLLLVRGGGSLEDLWAFNEEAVARAIYDCTIPIVSGIGHESDVSIADFVADVRAATPSAAAELVSPNKVELQVRLNQLQLRLYAAGQRRIQRQNQHLEQLSQRLQRQHPERRLQQQAQRLDELQLRLHRALKQQLSACQSRYANVQARFHSQVPAKRIKLLQTHHKALRQRLQQAIAKQLDVKRQQLHLNLRSLDSLSPLQTLARGYAIVLQAETGTVVSSAAQLKIGECIEVRLATGQLECTVDEISDDEKNL